MSEDRLLSDRVIREVEQAADQAIAAIPAYLRHVAKPQPEGSTELRFSDRETK